MKIYIGKENNPISATEFVDKIFSPNKEGLKKQKEGWSAWTNRDVDDKSITLDTIEHSDYDEPLDLDVNVRPYLVYKDGHTTDVGKRVKGYDANYTDDPEYTVVFEDTNYSRVLLHNTPKVYRKDINSFRYKLILSNISYPRVISKDGNETIFKVRVPEYINTWDENREESLKEGYYFARFLNRGADSIKSVTIVKKTKSFNGIDFKLEDGVDVEKALSSKKNLDKTAFRNKLDVSGKPFHIVLKLYKDFNFDPDEYDLDMSFVKKTTLQKLSEKSKSGKVIVEKEYPVTCNRLSPTKIEFILDITNPEVGLYRFYNNRVQLLQSYEYAGSLKFITPEFRIVETGNF
nr:MAG TPA: hypothetical protein [Crassvirales sp.]